MMTGALLFPGQGSQAIGMGAALAQAHPAAQAVFEEVNDTLSQDLTTIMWEGPEETLRLTANAQPALMAHSIAVLRTLEQECGLDIRDFAAVAGHSLGEYSALCAARALSLADTARLLRIRGEAMQAAVPVGAGAMAAIIGLDLETVTRLLEEVNRDGEGRTKPRDKAAEAETSRYIVEIANDNSPGQLVISGMMDAVEAACRAAKAAGAKRALPLPVSAPFHCCLMAPAAGKMQLALADTAFKTPVIPVVTNVTAEATQDAAQIRRQLVEQVTGRVRWTASIQKMAAMGVGQFYELGTGKVLSGLVRRILTDASVTPIGGPDDLGRFSA